jgi:hypothetical protein
LIFSTLEERLRVPLNSLRKELLVDIWWERVRCVDSHVPFLYNFKEQSVFHALRS